MSNELIYFLLGLLFSVIFGYYFYRKSIRIKEPVYSIKSNNLISGSVSTLENLNISYKDYKVENLTVSKILLYNRGAETITDQDIDTSDRLMIASETCDILDASILQVNKPSNNFRITLDKPTQHVYIDFKYLDQNQGAIIQVIHTGLSSDNLYIYGDIMGVEKLSKVDPKLLIVNIPAGTTEKRIAWIFGLITITFLYFVIFAGDELSALSKSINPFVRVSANLLAIFGFFGAIGFGGLALGYFSRLFAPDNRIPIGLEKFNE